MTYAESTRSSAVYSSIVPPPRTPIGIGGSGISGGGVSMLKDGGGGRKPLQPLIPPSSSSSPKNSLDYWSKSEDEKSGITCYYSRQFAPPPPPPPPTSSSQKGRGRGTGSFPSTSTRYPPFPHMTPPPPESVMSPPVGIYRPVPAMPRAKFIGAQKPRPSTEDDVVWGGGEASASSSASASAPLNPYASEKKRSTARRKPRWARCFQTLFCCVTPPREIEKIQSNQRSGAASFNNNHSSSHSINGGVSSSPSNGRSATPTNGSGPPIQLITQVHRDGTVTGLPNGQIGQIGQQQQIGSGDGPTAYEKTVNDSVGTINEKPLLPPLQPQDINKKCLVIDLDETLVHSSFKPVKNPDFVIPVEIDGVEHQVYVLKRPYVDEFLAKVGEHFECILFTASLAKYADPVADLLDKKKVFRGRLFREACVFHKGNYVKDLSRLGRQLNQTLIIDNSPASYAFHPENAVPVTTWFDDPADTELLDILPSLEHLNGFQSIYDLYRPEEGPNSELLNHCSC